jgi:hypothetical protein
MTERLQQVWMVALNTAIEFLPKLLSGVLLLLIGWVVAWVAKRMVIQIMILFRMERFLTRFRWGGAFGKADIRYGLYNLVGNIVFILVLLTFIDLTLIVWDLRILSDQLGGVILLLPRLVKGAVIALFGWFVARWSGQAIAQKAFRRRRDHAVLAAWFVRSGLLVVFGGMALYEVDVARPVLMVGFSILLVALCLLALLAGYAVMRDHQDRTGERRDPDQEDSAT